MVSPTIDGRVVHPTKRKRDFMKKFFTIILAVVLFGCDGNRLIEERDDQLGFGSVRIVALNESTTVFVGQWRSRETFNRAPIWSRKREFATADSARQFIVETRAEYILSAKETRNALEKAQTRQ